MLEIQCFKTDLKQLNIHNMYSTYSGYRTGKCEQKYAKLQQLDNYTAYEEFIFKTR